MYNCPSCGKENTERKNVCACGMDLTLLQCVESLADSWFNLALESLKNEQAGKAVEFLSACCAIQPSDAEAFRLRAKAWLKLGRFAEARDSLEKAREIDPDNPELELIEKNAKIIRCRVKQKKT